MAINFGWIPPKDRTKEQEKIHDEIMLGMPSFKIVGESPVTEGDKAYIWDCAKASNGGQHFNPIVQVTGSCFPAGVQVRMADGSEKVIEEIKVGDSVITHTGESHRVVDTMTRKYTGELYSFDIVGFPFPLEMTADHKLAVMPSKTNWRWEPSDEIEWKRADEIEEDDRLLIGYDQEGLHQKQTIDVKELLGEDCVDFNDLMENHEAPVSRIDSAKKLCAKSGIDWKNKVKLFGCKTKNAVNRYIPICPSFARLIGLYLAEGGSHDGRVTFTFSKTEENLASETLALVKGFFGVDGQISIVESRPSVITVRFNNLTLATLFSKLIPGNVYTKRVPSFIMSANEKVKMALIDGWMDGDGYAGITKGKSKSPRLVGVTVSQLLARDMTTLALSCGLRASCNKRKSRKQSKEAYNVELSGKKAVENFHHDSYESLDEKRQQAGTTKLLLQSDTCTARTKFGFARRVKAIHTRQVVDTQVYDFEVENDHSFIANGRISSNCVGAGGGHVLWNLQAVEVVRLGDNEEVKYPFWLLPYGKSREIGGLHGQGEGSFGSAFAEAMKRFGIVSADLPNLPTFRQSANGRSYSRAAELEWSNGRAINQSWLALSAKHIVKSAARLTSTAQVRQALLNYYPLTIASMWGGNMLASVQGSGENRRLINRRVTEWAHQMACIGYENNPQHGHLYYIMNTWGANTHGICPSGAPPGGFWVREEDMQFMLRGNEVFAFSQFEGFPAQREEIEKKLFKIVGT